MKENNLACIVSLPCFQGQGFGAFLVAASYAIGYNRGLIGTPERPLSDLGEATYFRYWRDQIWRWAATMLGSRLFHGQEGAVIDVDGDSAVATTVDDGGGDKRPFLKASIVQIAKELRLEESDVQETLLRLGLVHRTEKALEVLLPRELILRAQERERRLKAVATRGGVAVFEADKLRL